jgi:hypothetical protein
MLGIVLESTTQNEKKCNVLFEDGSCNASNADQVSLHRHMLNEEAEETGQKIIR